MSLQGRKNPCRLCLSVFAQRLPLWEQKRKSEIFCFAKCEIIYNANYEIFGFAECEMKQIPLFDPKRYASGISQILQGIYFVWHKSENKVFALMLFPKLSLTRGHRRSTVFYRLRDFLLAFDKSARNHGNIRNGTQRANNLTDRPRHYLYHVGTR